MTLLGLIITLIVVGVLLWAINSLLAPYIQPPILKIINVVVILVVLIYLLQAFGLLGSNGILNSRIGSK